MKRPGYHNRRVLYRWALILGLVGAIIAGLVLWVVFAFAQGRMTEPIGWLFVIFPLCSVAVGLKWPLVSGVLLILQGFAFIGQLSLALSMALHMSKSGLFGSLRSLSDAPFSWLLSIPLAAGLLLLASGVLFIISWRRRHKQGKSDK